jgi:hypothetical protein
MHKRHRLHFLHKSMPRRAILVKASGTTGRPSLLLGRRERVVGWWPVLDEGLYLVRLRLRRGRRASSGAGVQSPAAVGTLRGRLGRVD